jgi:hypothetical protein
MAAPDASGDTVLAGTSSDQALSDYLTHQKYVLGIDEIILISKTGSILATTDPTITGSFVDPDGITFDRAKTSTIFHLSFAIRKRKTISLRRRCSNRQHGSPGKDHNSKGRS